MQHRLAHTTGRRPHALDLLRQMDAALAAARGLDGRHGLTQASRSWYPRFEVVEHDDRTELFADVPGLRAESLSVKVEDGVLQVSGQFDATVDEGWEVASTERARWSFDRSWRLGRRLADDQVQASLADGVLTITVAKVVPQSVTIPVLEG